MSYLCLEVLQNRLFVVQCGGELYNLAAQYTLVPPLHQGHEVIAIPHETNDYFALCHATSDKTGITDKSKSH